MASVDFHGLPHLGFVLFLSGMGEPFPGFEFTDLKSHFFCLKFLSILTAYQDVVLSEEIVGNNNEKGGESILSDQ